VDLRRERFLKLRREGKSRAEAASAVRADKRSAADWDKGIRVFCGGREYPDGRVVRYGQGKIPSGVTSPRVASVHGEQVDLERVERVIDGRYLSLRERERLRDLQRAGHSIRKIAAILGRSPSTISRELRRNATSSQGYMPHAAHRASVQRRRRPRPVKLLSNKQLYDYVEAKLRMKWSPQQINHRLVRDFPDAPEMRVSTETIYHAIYVHARGELKRELARQLRRGRTARKPRRDSNTRRPRFVDPMTPIAMRPVTVEDRSIPGHWEGDLIIGAAGKSAIATLVERSSRFVILGHLGINRSADAVRDSLVAALSGLPDSLRGTLTWDQGAEMSEHRAFTTATNMAVYFCDPGKPWQRGSNENTNGLLRQYFPSGTDLRTHDTAALRAVADELNSRPRKSLDWSAPVERLADLLDAS
jgi:transposase, IS30 family